MRGTTRELERTGSLYRPAQSPGKVLNLLPGCPAGAEPDLHPSGSRSTAARTLDGASGKVGVMGFCLGGLMTFLTAARGNVDSAVAYYGGGTENHLSESDTVTVPLRMHLGEEDEFISKDAQREIKEAFTGNPHVEMHSYPGCSHAFARHSGIHYDQAAASIANRRTWTFFAKHLQ
jgi:carboxymethylenebutenolidase